MRVSYKTLKRGMVLKLDLLFLDKSRQNLRNKNQDDTNQRGVTLRKGPGLKMRGFVLF